MINKYEDEEKKKKVEGEVGLVSNIRPGKTGLVSPSGRRGSVALSTSEGDWSQCLV